MAANFGLYLILLAIKWKVAISLLPQFLAEASTIATS
jgi:hypothetical protein